MKFLQKPDLGVLLLRLSIGIRLLYGAADNIFNWNRMQEFEQYLMAKNFPLPLVCAIVSCYAQALCGITILLGFKTRIAALILVFNFTVAVLGAHWGDSFERMTPALAVLFCSMFFALNDAGKYALDYKLLK